MKRILGYALFGILAYGVALLLTCPAEWAMGQLAQQQPGLQFDQPSGTLLKGRVATLVYQGQRFERVRWQLTPWRWLQGKGMVQFSFQSPLRQGRGHVGLGLEGQIQLYDLDLQWPTNDLAPHLGLGGFELAGLLKLKVTEATLVGQQLHRLLGTLSWQGGGLERPMAIPLGDLLLRFVEVDTGIKGKLSDQGEAGPFDLEGILTLSEGGQYQLSGRVKARPGASPLAVQSLQFLGHPDGGGYRPLLYSGSL